MKTIPNRYLFKTSARYRQKLEEIQVAKAKEELEKYIKISISKNKNYSYIGYDPGRWYIVKKAFNEIKKELSSLDCVHGGSCDLKLVWSSEDKYIPIMKDK